MKCSSHNSSQNFHFDGERIIFNIKDDDFISKTLYTEQMREVDEYLRIISVKKVSIEI